MGVVSSRKTPPPSTVHDVSMDGGGKEEDGEEKEEGLCLYSK